eukprot:COSAG02_NODE_4535_length_5244_cov_3.635180_2_plen_93_part_01
MNGVQKSIPAASKFRTFWEGPQLTIPKDHNTTLGGDFQVPYAGTAQRRERAERRARRGGGGGGGGRGAGSRAPGRAQHTRSAGAGYGGAGAAA